MLLLFLRERRAEMLTAVHGSDGWKFRGRGVEDRGRQLTDQRMISRTTWTSSAVILNDSICSGKTARDHAVQSVEEAGREGVQKIERRVAAR